MSAEDEDPFEHTRMSLAEHLEELRSRLIKGVGAVVVAFVVAWIFRLDVAREITAPYHAAMDLLEAHYVAEAEGILADDPERARTDFFTTADPENQKLIGLDRRLSSIKPGESFLFFVRVSFYAALVFGAPVLLYQLWQFAAAGLYDREKRAVRAYFPLSLVAFAVGVLFGFFFIVPYGMYFLNKGTSIELMVPTITVEAYLHFLSSLCLTFGIVFQLPLVMAFLGGAGIVQPTTMSTYRGHFVVSAFVVAALLTPPDPFTQLMMALPLVILYEIGIVCARLTQKKRAAA